MKAKFRGLIAHCVCIGSAGTLQGEKHRTVLVHSTDIYITAEKAQASMLYLEDVRNWQGWISRTLQNQITANPTASFS